MTLFSVPPAAAELYARAARAAARKLGVYDALPGDVVALAARTGTKPRRLAALLDALCLEGTLRRRGAGFVAGARPAAEAPLPPTGWGLLAEVLRGDRHLDAEDGEAFHKHLARENAGPADWLWRRLDARGPLLDLGAGTGTFSRAFLEARPGASATLVDRPAVCALAAAQLPSGARLRPADLLTDALGSGFHTALLANVLHLYAPETCRRLLRRAAAALAPGGLLVVVDLDIRSDRSGPAAAVYFALNMALYTDGGTVHDPAVVAGWVAEAACAEARSVSLTSPGCSGSSDELVAIAAPVRDRRTRYATPVP